MLDCINVENNGVQLIFSKSDSTLHFPIAVLV